MDDLKNKVALVTGAARGIGAGIARAFVDAGSRVLVADVLDEEGSSLATKLGPRVRYRHLDVADEAQWATVVQETVDVWGGLDVLVNNAAANPYAGPTIDVPLPAWEKTLQVNITAPLVWTQLAWQRRMKEQGGAVINISSVGGLATNPILGVYDVTKAALIHLTKQLAAELGPKVRVNAIAPGLIKTDFARVLWEKGRGDQVAQAYPLKRLGEPEDVAAAALFLAADAASGWITGHTVVLDGGGLVGFNRPG